MKTPSTSRSSKPPAKQVSPAIPKTIAATVKSYGLAVAILLALPLIYFAFLFSPKPAVQPTASPDTVSANSAQGSCVDCHAEISARYAQSGMSQTWQVVASGCVGDFNADTRVVDERSNYEYQLHRVGNAVSQIERRSDGSGHTLERQAAFTVGSGKHAQAMVANENGYLTQMPIAWYESRQAWGLNPGFELRNQRFDRPIVPGCVACHSSGAQYDFPTKNRYHDRTISGIDCHRCHGDAAAHVSYWKKNKTASGDLAGDVINPARFTPSQANDLCLQCHLQGDVVLFLNEADPLKFQPGQRLRDQRHDFLIATEDNSRLGVASHGARMLQSK
ncbi:MAG: hypothetical protein IT423_17150, partial [Pirellulaceae bacterium]|nr:hypothetical protein [Pirellulaceae bacterium]